MATIPRLAGLLGRAHAEGDDGDDEEAATAEDTAADAEGDEDDMESQAADDGGEGDDDEDDGAPMADDGDDQEDDAQARAIRANERARIGRILNCPEAKGRHGLAVELAVGGGMSSKRAVAILSKAAKEQRPSKLDVAMAATKQPDVGRGGGTDKRAGLSAAVETEVKRHGLGKYG